MKAADRQPAAFYLLLLVGAGRLAAALRRRRPYGAGEPL
jgi:hypothetical protein